VPKFCFFPSQMGLRFRRLSVLLFHFVSINLCRAVWTKQNSPPTACIKSWEPNYPQLPGRSQLSMQMSLKLRKKSRRSKMLNECIAQITLWKPQDCVTLPSDDGDQLEGQWRGWRLAGVFWTSWRSEPCTKCRQIAHFLHFPPKVSSNNLTLN